MVFDRIFAPACANVDTELDDEESDESVEQHEQNPGVDDGFFVGTRAEPDDTHNKHDPNHNHNNDNHVPHENPSFPYAPGFNPNVVSKMLDLKTIILFLTISFDQNKHERVTHHQWIK